MNKNSILFLIALFVICITASLSANPFLGQEEDKGPAAPRQSGKAQNEKFRDLQRDLSERISEQIRVWDENPSMASWLIIMTTAFLYGLFHAAGPGHRKTVVFSLFLGRDSRWWEPAAAGFLSAALHAGSGVALVLILSGISRRFLSNRVNDTAVYLEGGTYLILCLVAAILLIRKLIHFITRKEKDHQNKKSGSLYSIIAASSLFPCPISIMLILFSVALNQIALGITAVSILSLGMGVTISVAAYLAFTGRKKLFDVLKKKERKIKLLSDIMESAAYGFLFLFSLWMGYPFFRSLLV